MNKRLLNTVVQDFINNNIDADIPQLLLHGSTFEGISIQEIAEQIVSKKRCRNKLPTWFNTSGIYYPNKLNIEQTSSEITAVYKAGLIQGNRLIDLTGGFGVDSFFFAKHFKLVTYCEIDATLSDIVSHNFRQLGVKNIETQHSNGLEFLFNSQNTYDWIYIDPSRRHDSKGKVYYLKDCAPNVPEHLSQLLNHSSNILIKASPMLDLSVAFSELDHIKDVHIIAVNNEVKELLFVLQKNHTGSIAIKTANLLASGGMQLFDFKWDEIKSTTTTNSDVETYLYEPNAAIMKSGAFQLLPKYFEVKKLHKHTHLYTSMTKEVFPGRTFLVRDCFPYNKKAVKRHLSSKKANIAIRNFPETVQQLRRKFNIKDGGDIYCFFATGNLGEKIVIIADKI